MSLFSFISAAGLSLAVFVCLLLLSKKKKRISDWLLAGWLLTLGLNQAFFLVSGTGASVSLAVGLAGIAMVLLHPPLLWLFVKHAFSEELPPKELIHLIPFSLFILIFGGHAISNPETIAFVDGFMILDGNTPVLLSYYGSYFALAAGGYTLAAYFQILKQKKRIEQVHSNHIRNLFNWLQAWIIAALVFFGITYTVIEVSLFFNAIDTAFTFKIISSFITVYIFYVSFFGMRHTRAFQKGFPLPVVSNVSVPKDQSELRQITDGLDVLLREQHLYLNPDLTLPDLSKASGIPSGKISLALNQGLNKNFYQFINEYRTREFIRRLHDDASTHLSLLGLAHECGFRSKSTFNSFFKQYTSQTPSRYKKNSANKSA